MGVDKEKLGYAMQALAALAAAPVAAYPQSGEFLQAKQFQDQSATFTAQEKAKKEAKKAKKKAKKNAFAKTGLTVAGNVLGGPVGATVGSALGDSLAGQTPDVTGLTAQEGTSLLPSGGLLNKKKAVSALGAGGVPYQTVKSSSIRNPFPELDSSFGLNNPFDM